MFVAGFMGFVVQPLLREWQKLSATPLTDDMLRNVACNKTRWETIHVTTKPTHDALATTSLTDDEEHVTSHATRQRAQTVSVTRRAACALTDGMEMTSTSRDEHVSRRMRAQRHVGVLSLGRRRNSLPAADVQLEQTVGASSVNKDTRICDETKSNKLQHAATTTKTTTMMTNTHSPKLHARKAPPPSLHISSHHIPETLDVHKASPPPFDLDCDVMTSLNDDDDVMTEQENERNLFMYNKMRRCSAPTVRAHLSCLDNQLTSHERRASPRQQQQSSLFMRGASKLLFVSLFARRNSLPLKLKDLASARSADQHNNNNNNLDEHSCSKSRLINACS